MGDLFILFFFSSLIVAVLIVIPIGVLIHELGHAFLFYFFTRKPVTVYIGTFGDNKNCFRLDLGVFEFWILKNPLKWKKGLCVPQQSIKSVLCNFLTILAGPLGWLLFAGLFVFFSFYLNLHSSIKVVSFVFAFNALIDFYQNLKPNSSPIILDNGSITYNDGQQLKMLLRFVNYPKEYVAALKFYEMKEYSKAAKLSLTILKNGYKTHPVYKIAFVALIENGNFDKAEELWSEMKTNFELDSNDYGSRALIYSRRRKNEEALEYYEKSLELDPNNIYTLNNYGFALIELGFFKRALFNFDKAIEINPKHADFYCNRGLAKIELNDVENGLNDIKQSLVLDDKNSYGYRNLGIYHLRKNETDLALNLFIKARELDPNTYVIEDLIKSASNYKPKMN